jgi:hypothetical protein
MVSWLQKVVKEKPPVDFCIRSEVFVFKGVNLWPQRNLGAD